MTPKEFRDKGYLQELNRQFLHPLGLALEVELLTDGTERFGDVWDYRKDSEGMIYDVELIDSKKAKRIADEQAAKREVRELRFGFDIQPYPYEK
jgi:hypothetical protein